MPVRGGGDEMVQGWMEDGKKGPLWIVPLLIEMYPTQANPTSGWIHGTKKKKKPTPFSLRGAPVPSQEPAGKQRGGG